jgi:tetratricopeptide (TPR) repeat protein
VRLGLSNVVATAKHNLGRALQHRGELAEALATEQEALELFDRQLDRRLTGAARLYLSYILLELGDHARAQAEIKIALLTAQRPMQAQMLASLARVVLARGEVAEASRLAHDAYEILAEVGGIEEGEALVRLMVVETRLASGDRVRAREVARIAHARILERAARITDPVWRASFLAIALGVAGD